MALKQFGLTSYTFGFSDTDAAAIAATLGLTPQEGTISGESEVRAEGKDAYNRTVALVIEDGSGGKNSFNLSGYISNSTLFNAARGKVFTYQSKIYIVETAERGVKKDDFQMGTVTAVNYSQITSSSSSQIAA